MAVSLYFLCPIFFLAAAVNSACPKGWIVYKESCYMFSNESHNFLDAERACAHYGAHHVHINDAAENGFLKSFAHHFGGERWIGLTDELIENDWLWYDTNEQAVFTDWDADEPNQGLEANCAHFWVERSYQWADVNCHLEMKYLCEINKMA